MGALNAAPRSGAIPPPASDRTSRPIARTATVVALGVVAVVAVLWVVLSYPLPSQGGPGIQGPYLVVGPPAETHAGGSHSYNFSPQSVSGGLKLDDKVFQIQTSGRAIVPAGSDWKVEILGITGTPIGNDTYSLQNESWYATASTPLASGETISLESAGTVLNGNNLDVLGKGPYQGSVSVEIP